MTRHSHAFLSGHSHAIMLHSHSFRSRHPHSFMAWHPHAIMSWHSHGFMWHPISRVWHSGSVHTLWWHPLGSGSWHTRVLLEGTRLLVARHIGLSILCRPRPRALLSFWPGLGWWPGVLPLLGGKWCGRTSHGRRLGSLGTHGASHLGGRGEGGVRGHPRLPTGLVCLVGRWHHHLF